MQLGTVRGQNPEVSILQKLSSPSSQCPLISTPSTRLPQNDSQMWRVVLALRSSSQGQLQPRTRSSA